MKYGFIKAAALSPALRVADCTYNVDQILLALEQADRQGVRLACLPELSITSYTCGDLFLQRPLMRAAEEGLARILEASKQWSMLILVGLPVQTNGKLYNCAAVLCGGQLLGVVPKTSLPNYGEFCEKRWFNSAPAQTGSIVLCGQQVPFGTKLLFRCRQLSDFCLAAEICEDLWAPLPPSIGHALAGATVIANLSASSEVVGKADYRRRLVSGQSARLLSAYVYANPGRGESTTDLVFGGHNIIAENGEILAESRPFENALCISEIDTEHLICERARNTSFVINDEGYTTVEFDLEPRQADLTRSIHSNPFMPDPQICDERCELILNMQAESLAQRMAHTHAQTAVVGISGGLDSTLALLASVRAMQLLGKPSTDVHAFSMPCFGTTHRTRSNAQILCEELGVTFQELNITATVRSHFADIGQPEDKLDVTFENSQARVRTLELMDLANRLNGLVVGTGDLSELALGWATYNGDHMSMYGVNAGIPKTLVQHIVRHAAEVSSNPTLRKVLLDILATPVSPELLPAKDDQISQQTEQLVGPYELHDFFLFYILRFGFGPAKVLHLARQAFKDRYSDDVLKHWMQNFYRRFFAQQFKRSCLPDGPKIGSITLSPRGSWKMPSDACAALWQKELEPL